MYWDVGTNISFTDGITKTLNKEETLKRAFVPNVEINMLYITLFVILWLTIVTSVYHWEQLIIVKLTIEVCK